MNKSRRKMVSDALEAVHTIRDDLQAVLEGDLGTGKDEEREAFENLPEGLQATYVGQEIERCADSLDEAWQTLDSCLSDIESAIASIEEVL